MGLTFASTVESPGADVFEWHEKPGAFARLSPPWQPMHLLADADSLRDGTAELALPGGFRLIAEHQPDGYDPPRRFVDAIARRGIGMAMRWRHSHEVDDLGDGRSRMTDRVDTPIPGALLRPMFVYRHR